MPERSRTVPGKDEGRVWRLVVRSNAPRKDTGEASPQVDTPRILAVIALSIPVNDRLSKRPRTWMVNTPSAPYS